MVRSFKKKTGVLLFLSLLQPALIFASSCHGRGVPAQVPVASPTTARPGTEPRTKASLTETVTSRTLTTSEDRTSSETQVETEETALSTRRVTLTSSKKTTCGPLLTREETSRATTGLTAAATTTPTAPSGAHYKEDHAQGLLLLLNAERAKIGKPALAMNASLVGFAKTRAKELSECPDRRHRRPNDLPGYTIITIPHSRAGENLGAGQKTPERMIKCWMNSACHRDVMLDTIPGDTTGFTQVGIACYCVPDNLYKTYWAMLLMAP